MPNKPAEHARDDAGGRLDRWPWFGLIACGEVIHRSDYMPRSPCGRWLDFAGIHFLEAAWRDMPQLRCGTCLNYKEPQPDPR